MHELAITENILDIALRHAKGQHITGVHIVIGQLSSFVDDSVQFYWDIISIGTSAEGANLFFRRIPTLLQCRACARQFSPTQINFTCPDCGSPQVKVIAGDEFYLESIEVNT